MSIAPIKAGGWAEGEKLTPAQLNDFQAKLIGAGDDIGAHGVLLATVLTTLVELNTRLVPIEDVAWRPDKYFELREDFVGAVFDAGDSIIYGAVPWRTGGSASGVVAVNNRPGNSRHPGLLEVAIPGLAGNERAFYFHLIEGTGDVFDPAQIEAFTLVLKIVDDPDNLNTSLRIGFVADNTVFNGGTDGLSVLYQKGIGATTFQLLRRKAGVQVTTVLGTQTAGQYAVIRFVKSGTNLQVFFGNSTTPATTITAAQLPAVMLTLGAHMLTSSADPDVFTPSIDLIAARIKTDTRAGV